MALARTPRRGGGDNGLNAWPGYVDALSTLLMVIIFVLLVFVLAQAFLSVALSGRDRRSTGEPAARRTVDMLSLERGHGGSAAIDRPAQSRPAGRNAARDTLTQQLAALQDQATGQPPTATRCARTRQAGAAACRCRLQTAVGRGAHRAAADAAGRGRPAAPTPPRRKRRSGDAAGRYRATGRCADTARARCSSRWPSWTRR